MWLSDLVSLQPNDMHARYYATQVKEASQGRRLRRAITEMSSLALNLTRPAADVQAECEQILFAVGDVENANGRGGPRCASELANEALNRIDGLVSGEIKPGLQTGFGELDRLWGGMEAGELAIIAARPSVGKTAFSTAIATNVSAVGESVLLFSLEMPRVAVTQRILAMRSGVPHQAIRSARLDSQQIDAVTKAARQFGSEPFHIEDTAPMNVARIAANIRRYVRRHGMRLAVIDYLGLVEPENPTDNKVHQIGLVAKRVKEIAMSCSVPVILLCQLNRAVEDRPGGKPRLSDLRDSGEVEQHADTVILLSRQDMNPDPREDVWLIDVQLAKQRNGVIGEVTLAFCHPVVRYQNAPISC